ncbi:gluconokinase [Sphingomonas gei]|uniref:Gluconokinase n=1 Tax=Sphingomonas gei TaxID=1395960 RepID=A0A4S1XI44_9SPHN|nr:gluconokinase [Sphingomonas gei]TGX56329.1 gluconokinase [Sphingomonas gei]
MGVSGCGKTTLGALLAEALHCPFLDGDDFHAPEAVAKMRSGQPLDDMDRWPWLERLGAATARAIAEHGAAVTACSALRRSYRDRLRATIGRPARFVLLDIPRAQLLQRLTDRGGHFMPATLLDSQLATLERPLDEADSIIFADESQPLLLRDLILAQLPGGSARHPAL